MKKRITYDDWKHFIQMDKKDWNVLKRWMKEHGLELEEVPPKVEHKVTSPKKRGKQPSC